MYLHYTDNILSIQAGDVGQNFVCKFVRCVIRDFDCAPCDFTTLARYYNVVQGHWALSNAAKSEDVFRAGPKRSNSQFLTGSERHMRGWQSNQRRQIHNSIMLVLSKIVLKTVGSSAKSNKKVDVVYTCTLCKTLKNLLFLYSYENYSFVKSFS